jgi:hypothetical protein
MTARRFRFDFASLRRHRFAAPRRPRHPLLRLAFGLIGLGLLLALVFVGVFVGLAMLAAGVLWRLWRRRGKPIADDPRALDGEFRVVGKPALSAVEGTALPSA